MLDGSEEASGTICMEGLAGRVNGKAVMALSASRRAASVAPRSLAVRYYDAARDYQAGLQKATRPGAGRQQRSEEHTSELQSLMRISYAVFCLKKKTHN